MVIDNPYDWPNRDHGMALPWKKRSSSAAVLSEFNRKVMVVLATDIRGVCYYEIPTEHETNTALHFKFLNGLVDRWHSNRTHTVFFVTTPCAFNCNA